MIMTVFHNIDITDQECGLGYATGQRLVPVFSWDHGHVSSTDEAACGLAEVVWTVAHVPFMFLTGRLAGLARSYSDRELRPMRTGDVARVGLCFFTFAISGGAQRLPRSALRLVSPHGLELPPGTQGLGGMEPAGLNLLGGSVRTSAAGPPQSP